MHVLLLQLIRKVRGSTLLGTLITAICCDSTSPAVLLQPFVAHSCPNHQPFRLVGEAAESDWVQHVELDTARGMADQDAGEPLKVLVLYGSLRQRSYSKLLAYEFARCAQQLPVWMIDDSLDDRRRGLHEFHL